MKMKLPNLPVHAVQTFIRNGFVRIDNAFSSELAVSGREILWRDTGCDPQDHSTWTRPVVRLGDYAQPPFIQAANTPLLHSAFDLLVGPARWLPRGSLGTFPVRFPSADDPGDAGWHLDMSFAGRDSDPADFFSWRINLQSRGRALLMLFLFSDVGPDDAPTRIRVGSHRVVARMLSHAGEDGLSLHQLMAEGFDNTADCDTSFATGPAGTVYLCHPFIVHAAQPHRGTKPRFMAQPPLLPRAPLELERANGTHWPVEEAIRQALLEGRA
jgi:Phytanoyl-CoA dioxygenase (PhyH)